MFKDGSHEFRSCLSEYHPQVSKIVKYSCNAWVYRYKNRQRVDRSSIHSLGQGSKLKNWLGIELTMILWYHLNLHLCSNATGKVAMRATEGKSDIYKTTSSLCLRPKVHGVYTKTVEFIEIVRNFIEKEQVKVKVLVLWHNESV